MSKNGSIQEGFADTVVLPKPFIFQNPHPDWENKALMLNHGPKPCPPPLTPPTLQAWFLPGTCAEDFLQGDVKIKEILNSGIVSLAQGLD